MMFLSRRAAPGAATSTWAMARLQIGFGKYKKSIWIHVGLFQNNSNNVHIHSNSCFPHFLLTLPPLRSVILDALNSTSSVLENSFSTQSGNNSENHSGNNGNVAERGEEERMTWLQRWDQPLCSSSLEPPHLPPQWSWTLTIAGSNRNSRSGGRGRRKHNRSQLSL